MSPVHSVTHVLVHSPLSGMVSSVLDRGADVSRVGVAGGKDPLRRVAKDRRAGGREGNLLPTGKE